MEGFDKLVVGKISFEMVYLGENSLLNPRNISELLVRCHLLNLIMINPRINSRSLSFQFLLKILIQLTILQEFFINEFIVRE